jgi:hypothetical protein
MIETLIVDGQLVFSETFAEETGMGSRRKCGGAQNKSTINLSIRHK